MESSEWSLDLYLDQPIVILLTGTMAGFGSHVMPAANMGLDRDRQAVPQLYELLRNKIVSLQLAPGTVLSRAALAHEYGVSQTPVRDALLRLSEEKLVDVFPQASTRVSLIDITLARETHFLRRSLELEIVRELALHGDPLLIIDLQAHLKKQEILRDARNFAAFTEADMAFHHALYLAADMEPMWKMLISRSGHLDRLRRLHLPVIGKLERIVKDHQRIVAAIAEKNIEKAQLALREHLSGTLEYVPQIMRDHTALIRPL